MGIIILQGETENMNRHSNLDGIDSTRRTEEKNLGNSGKRVLKTGKEKEDHARGNTKGKIRNIFRKKGTHGSQRKRISIKGIGLVSNTSEKSLLFKNSVCPIKVYHIKRSQWTFTYFYLPYHSSPTRVNFKAFPEGII